jgi:HNH endonuclease
VIAADRLRELLDYDQETGLFTWRLCTSNRIRVGQVAGCLRKDGRLTIRVDGELALAHRLAWLHVYGEWPFQVIDHVNGDPLDNRISNLRDVSQLVNTLNLHKVRPDNKSGSIGVSRLPNGRWLAQLGRNKWRASYDSFEDAVSAYALKKQEVLSSLL